MLIGKGMRSPSVKLYPAKDPGAREMETTLHQGLKVCIHSLDLKTLRFWCGASEWLLYLHKNRMLPRILMHDRLWNPQLAWSLSCIAPFGGCLQIDSCLFLHLFKQLLFLNSLQVPNLVPSGDVTSVAVLDPVMQRAGLLATAELKHEGQWPESHWRPNVCTFSSCRDRGPFSH